MTFLVSRRPPEAVGPQGRNGVAAQALTVCYVGTQPNMPCSSRDVLHAAE